jgi:hypothetical protein
MKNDRQGQGGWVERSVIIVPLPLWGMAFFYGINL